MKKILIIGKRGFIGNSLAKYLKNKFNTKHISFDQLKRKKNIINNFNWVINSSINPNYIDKKYNIKFDNDANIAEFINNKKTKYVFLSSRKVYRPNINIKETSKIETDSNYSKNKFITERRLYKKLKNNLIILRISNIIGDKTKIKKLHSTFIDLFIKNIKKGYILDNKDDFKDFISIKKFNQIIFYIIKKNLNGVYNLSLGQKVSLNELISWLNKNNKKKYIIKKNINYKSENFYLNNKKLMKKLNIKNSKKELKDYCLNLSKKIFLNKS